MKKFIAGLLSTVLLFSTVGCGSTNSESENTTANANESASTDSNDDLVVNIGTMDLVNGGLIALYEKYYEDQLGVKVNLINFDSGKDVNTAVASGAVDIAQMGSAPTALAISNNLDYEVVWVSDVIGAAESLAVKEDSGINSIADLKGKTIATPFSSTAHYSLLNALKLEGISENDVTILDLETKDIYASWVRGDIDGAYVWYPVLGQLVDNGGKIIIGSDELAQKGVITADLMGARGEFAKAHPDIVTKYVKAQLQANDVIFNDPDKAADEISQYLEIPKEDAQEQMTQFMYLNSDEEIEYLNKLPDTLKSTADFLVEQNSIKSAPELDKFKESVTTEFVENAVK
jgi:taurine transport system substrate-binding protein